MELIFTVLFDLLSSAGIEVSEITKILIIKNAGLMMWEILKWNLAAAGIGVMIALISVIISKMLSKTNLFVKTSGWLSVFMRIMRIVMLLIVIGLTITIGALEGVRQGTKIITAQSNLVDQLFPEIGNAGADFMAILYLKAPAFIENESNTVTEKSIVEKLESFRKGEWELNIPVFKNLIEQAGDKMVAETIAMLKADAKRDYPILRGGTGEKLLDFFMAQFGESFVRKQGKKKAEQFKVLKPATAIYKDLDALAEKSGKPDSVSHRELSPYLVEKIIIKPVLGAVNSFISTNQMFILFISAIVLLAATAAGSCLHRNSESDEK